MPLWEETPLDLRSGATVEREGVIVEPGAIRA
jgi:hypothetical protein